MNCAIYARYSSDRQQATSIDDQIRRCRQWADRSNWPVLDGHIYVDQAQTGTNDDRAGLQALLAAAKQSRPFDCILIDDSSRLSRDLADTLNIVRGLRFVDIRVVAVSQGLDSFHEDWETQWGMYGVMDSNNSRRIGTMTHRGMVGKLMREGWVGGRCYGYRNGTIFEQEAQIVRRIYQDSASGQSLKKLAKQLNAEKIPPPQPYRGQKHPSWSPAALSVMLHNERYRGKLVWNRTRKVKNPDTGRKVQKARPQNEWITREVPAIVSDEMWLRVQGRFEALARSDAASGRRAHYLLSGLLVCGECGARMVVNSSSRQYVCPYNKQRGICPNILTIDRAGIEGEVRAALEEQVFGSIDTVIDEFIAAVQAEIKPPQSTVTQLQRQIDRLSRIIAEGNDSPALLERLREMEQRLAQERKVREMPTVKPADLARFVREQVADLKGLLDRHMGLAKQTLLQHLSEIVVKPGEGGYTLEAKWSVWVNGGGPNLTQTIDIRRFVAA